MGWRVQFLISGNLIDIKYRSDTDLTSADIQNASANERTTADEILQLGETIQIGRMTWVVRSRSIPICWKKTSKIKSSSLRPPTALVRQESLWFPEPNHS